MDLRSRSISKYEIETLFRDVLNQSQIENISNLLKLLGLYVFLDREMLDILSERHFNQKIGLSYIQKAVKYNLVAEMQSDKNLGKYYFQLKSGGFAFLNEIEFKYRKLPLDAASSERSKILSINQFLFKNGHLLTNKYGFGVYEPIFTQELTVLFEIGSADEWSEHIEAQKLFDVSEWEFKRMELQPVELDSKVKGNAESMLI